MCLTCGRRAIEVMFMRLRLLCIVFCHLIAHGLLVVNTYLIYKSTTGTFAQLGTRLLNERGTFHGQSNSIIYSYSM